MCRVIPAILAGGRLSAPPCTPTPWLSLGIEPVQKPFKRRRLIPSGWRAFRPVRNLTLTTVIADGAQPRASAALETSAVVSPTVTTKGRSCPLDTRPTVRRLDAANVSPLDHFQRSPSSKIAHKQPAQLRYRHGRYTLTGSAPTDYAVRQNRKYGPRNCCKASAVRRRLSVPTPSTRSTWLP